MPALQPEVPLITLEQYETLPEDKRVEVFDGIVYDMSSPSQEHQTISIELSTILNTYIKRKNGLCRVFHAPFDVKLSDHPLTIVQPDLMIICDKDKLDGKKCNGAPDWVIEIVSPSSMRLDYLVKLLKYSVSGVREYWIVDPLMKNITVHNFETETMEIYNFSDTVKAGIYDDLYIDFSSIME